MIEIFFFASLKSMKKGVGSGSVGQRYGSADPDLHQKCHGSPFKKKSLPSAAPSSLEEEEAGRGAGGGGGEGEWGEVAGD